MAEVSTRDGINIYETTGLLVLMSNFGSNAKGFICTTSPIPSPLPVNKWIFQGMNFLVPRPRRLRKTRGPGAQLEFALQIRTAYLCTRFSRQCSSANFFFQNLPSAVSTLQEMSPNVLQAQTFAGGTFWREIAIQAPRTRDAVSSLTRSRYVMKLCFIATFEYLDG